MAGALGSLPGASTVLGNIGSGQPRQRRQQQPGAQQQAARSNTTAQPPQTFAQMQQQGVARPAPPQPAQPAQAATNALTSPGTNQIQSQLQGAVSQALANPSRYDTSTFNTLRDSATNDLSAQYAKIRDTTDTNLASRGLAASTYGANDLHDVDAAQSRDLANLNSSLLQQAATTQAGDTQAAISGGNNYLSQQLNQALGLGNLGINQQNANTGAQSVANQFSLGQGNLGLGQQQLAQQGSQFGQTMGLNQQQLALQSQLGLGNLGLQQQQVANQANQFGQTYDLSKLQNQQQYGLQQQQVANQASQFGQTLGLNQQQINNQNNQFGQTFGLQQQAQNTQQQQFSQQLQQALGIATMQDQTQNRGIDVQGQNSQLAQILQMVLAGGGYGGASGGGASASGGTGTGATSTGSATGSGATQNTALQSNLMQSNPQLYAALYPNAIVNYNGQQYTTQQWAQYLKANPTALMSSGDASNANFFAQNAKDAAANQAAYRTSLQQGQQAAQQSNALQGSIQQFFTQYNDSTHTGGAPGSAEYYAPNPAFTDSNGKMWSQAERDQLASQYDPNPAHHTADYAASSAAEAASVRADHQATVQRFRDQGDTEDADYYAKLWGF